MNRRAFLSAFTAAAVGLATGMRLPRSKVKAIWSEADVAQNVTYTSPYSVPQFYNEDGEPDRHQPRDIIEAFDRAWKKVEHDELSPFMRPVIHVSDPRSHQNFLDGLKRARA